ncbi:unnamed protein product, partial [Ilex paraguariensis]
DYLFTNKDAGNIKAYVKDIAVVVDNVKNDIIKIHGDDVVAGDNNPILVSTKECAQDTLCQLPYRNTFTRKTSMKAMFPLCCGENFFSMPAFDFIAYKESMGSSEDEDFVYSYKIGCLDK